MSYTILVALGTNDELNVKWLRQHRELIPPNIRVLLIENYEALCLRTANEIRYTCLHNDNWQTIIPVRELLESNRLLHGVGLDIAMEFVTTPYVLTMDSDFFVHNAKLFEDILRAAEEHNAAIVGKIAETSTIPYVQPYCALYQSDLARQFKFVHRYVSQDYIRRVYIKEKEKIDPYAPLRKGGYLDVGTYLHIEVARRALTIVDFPVDNYGTHLWGQSPSLPYAEPGVLEHHVRLVLPNGDRVEFYDF